MVRHVKERGEGVVSFYGDETGKKGAACHVEYLGNLKGE